MMKKTIIPLSALCFLCIANACFKDECGTTGSGCDGTTMVWCENDDYDNPTYYDCAQDGLTCARFNSEMPECVMGCSKAETGTVLTDGCIDEFTVNLYECTRNPARELLIDNPGTDYYYENRTETCEHGCDPGLGDCILWHPDEYLPCNDDYIPSCQGDVLGFCRSDHTVHVYDCYEKGKTCAVVNGIADCADVCDPATFPVTTECIVSGDNAFERTTFCTDDGYVDFVEVPCEFGYFKDEKRCKAHPDEGEPCTSVDARCIDAYTVLECVQDKLTWQAFSCLDSQICLNTKANYGTCLDRCTTPETTFKCRDAQNSEFATCSEIQGNLVISESGTSNCEFGCSAVSGQCKLSSLEGTACPKSGNLCEGNILLYCAANRLLGMDCEKEGKVCAHDSENHFGCMPPCTTPGEKASCSQDGMYSNVETCISQDGSNALEIKSIYCEKGCRVSTGECNSDQD